MGTDTALYLFRKSRLEWGKGQNMVSTRSREGSVDRVEKVRAQGGVWPISSLCISRKRISE